LGVGDCIATTGENDMRLKPRLSMLFCRQDAAALIAVAIYIAVAVLLVQAWSVLSDNANAFDRDLSHANTAAPAPAIHAPTERRQKQSGRPQRADPPHQGILACDIAVAPSCETLKGFLPE
jgi:hypothetical protein